MARDYQQAMAGKRPPASKNVSSKNTNPKLKGYNQEDIDRSIRYIDRVRKTGIHWQHHIERLEKKYDLNVVKIYHELVADVKANNRKKEARKQAKLAKLNRKNTRSPPPSSAGSSSSGTTSSSSSGSSESNQTFSSLGVTQSAIERQRGRPKKHPVNPSRLSQQPTIQATSGLQKERLGSDSNRFSQPDSARFSLSDDGSSLPDMGFTTDTSYDPDPQTLADFFADLPPPLSKQKPVQQAHNTTQSSQSQKKPKYDKKKQTRVTEFSSQEDDFQEAQITRPQASAKKVSQREENPNLHYSSKTTKKFPTAPPVNFNEKERPPSSRKGQAPVRDTPPSGSKPVEPSSRPQRSMSSSIEELYSSPEDADVSSPDGKSRTEGKRKHCDTHESSQDRPREAGRKRKRRSEETTRATEPAIIPASTRTKTVLPEPKRMKQVKQDIAPWNVQAATTEIEDTTMAGPSTPSPVSDPDVARILSNGLPDFFAHFHDESNNPSAPQTAGPASATATTSALQEPGPFPFPVEPANQVSAAFSSGNARPSGSTTPADASQRIEAYFLNNAMNFGDPDLATTASTSNTVPAAQLQHRSPGSTGAQTSYNRFNQNVNQQRYGEIASGRNAEAVPTGINNLPVEAHAAQGNMTGNAVDQDASIKDLKINEGIMKSLEELGFGKLSDFAKNDMGKEEIRLFIAAIADELKLRKPETLAAIFKISAAVLRYQERKARFAGT